MEYAGPYISSFLYSRRLWTTVIIHLRIIISHFFHLFISSLLRPNITKSPTLPTRPRLPIPPKSLHSRFNLRPQIRTMKLLLVHQAPTLLTIPPQPIHRPFRTRLLNHNADRIGEPDGVVRCVWWEQIHVAFVYWYVDEFVGGWVDGFEEHGAFVLVEVFGGCVYVVICSGVWAAYHLFGVSLFFL